MAKSRLHKSNSIPGKNKGLVLILTIMALPVLLMITGLAIDTGRIYLVKAKLFAAVDAAGIAAARAVANGEDAAKAAASKYFNVNFPTDFMKSTAALATPVFSSDEFGNITIDVTGSATMPNTFLSMFGYKNWTVSALAQTIRRPVDIVLVVDNTTSLKSGVMGDVTQDVVDRSKSFVSNFHESFDRLALVKFAYGAEVPVPFNDARGFNKSTVKNEIDAFSFGGYGTTYYTNASEGMYRALDEVRNVPNPASLKVIVFFTDGSPNTFASDFEFMYTSKSYTGSLRAGGSTSGTPRGLWKHKKIAETKGSSAYKSSNIDDYIEELPEYYNAHDASANEFKVLNPDHPRRPVYQYGANTHSANDLYKRINRVARNLVEDMAEAARKEDIYVFTLGLGSSLQTTTGPDYEIGEEMLLRMANDPSMLNNGQVAGDFKSDQLQGLYCHAVNEYALGPCFDQMLDIIIRLTL
ncbi:VWA domain-containing protein [Vibrio sp. HN007]|uniref:VWA domain-containing protein n=1 Tax=Vibrio iocasae TaxID=3098914 RepID=UPI0035D4814D